jgi:hypothetical protein
MYVESCIYVTHFTLSTVFLMCIYNYMNMSLLLILTFLFS